MSNTTYLTAKQENLINQASRRAASTATRKKVSRPLKIELERIKEAPLKQPRVNDAVKVRVIADGEFVETLIVHVVKKSKAFLTGVIRDAVKFTSTHGLKNHQSITVMNDQIYRVFRDVSWSNESDLFFEAQ